MIEIQTKKQLWDFLNKIDTFTTTLMVYLYSKHDTDFLEWDSITFNQVMFEEFGEYPSQELSDKVGAGTSLFTSDSFFKSVNAFNAICSTIGLEATVTELFLPADLDSVMWGCSEARLLLGDIYDDSKFIQDIQTLVGKLLTEQGIYKPPTILDFADYPDNVDRNIRDNMNDSTLLEVYYSKNNDYMEWLKGLINSRLVVLLDQLAALPIKMNVEFVKKMKKNIIETIENSSVIDPKTADSSI